MATKNFLIGALSTTALVLTLSAAPAKAEIVLSGDPNGWQFGFDGFVNVFAMDSGASTISGGRSVTTRQGSTVAANGNRFTVGDGLMPEAFGFNAHSPDLNGNKVNGRLSLEPSIGSGSFNNTATSSSGVMEVREAFTSIGGAWGEVQAGKSLGLFGSQAIANDITLFGVGAGAATATGVGNTTLGRIGYGYQYAGWQPNIRYTSPVFLGGFKGVVGIFQANSITTDGNSADRNRLPKVEAGLSWAGKAWEAPLSLWLNGTWQNGQVNNSSAVTYNSITYNMTNRDISVGGAEMGGKVTIGPVDAVLHGYIGSGLPVNGLQTAGSATDASGQTLNSYGFYAQAAYHFGQGTSVAASYGANYVDTTSIQDAAMRNNANATLNQQSMFTFQVWHEVNKYFRVVGEYDVQKAYWNDSASQTQHTGAVGVVATW